MLLTSPSIRRAAALVYRYESDGMPRFLFVSTRKNPARLVMPAGRIDAGENGPETALRETREEAGAHILIDQLIGSYPHRKRNGRTLATDVYLASWLGGGLSPEGRRIVWLSLDASAARDLDEPVRKMMKRVSRMPAPGAVA
jgi:8-oxo-dGTP pyrophosphatase MutT (NUDIX family)